MTQQQSDYLEFRGKCKELSEAACATDSSLRLVRGYYWCPIWKTHEQHWWCEREDGTVVDPTAKQFPSKGAGTYTEFDGYFDCTECGKRVHEDDVYVHGRYAFCSGPCCARFVGVDI